MALLEKGKQVSKNYDILKQQAQAKDNMIADFLAQRQQHKKEGQELVK